MNFEQLTNKKKDSGVLNNIELKENKITGELKQYDFDYKGARYTMYNAPGGLMTLCRPTGFVVLEFKEGKFRVTLTKIFLVHSQNDPIG